MKKITSVLVFMLVITSMATPVYALNIPIFSDFFKKMMSLFDKSAVKINSIELLEIDENKYDGNFKIKIILDIDREKQISNLALVPEIHYKNNLVNCPSAYKKDGKLISFDGRDCKIVDVSNIKLVSTEILNSAKDGKLEILLNIPRYFGLNENDFTDLVRKGEAGYISNSDWNGQLVHDNMKIKISLWDKNCINIPSEWIEDRELIPEDDVDGFVEGFGYSKKPKSVSFGMIKIWKTEGNEIEGSYSSKTPIIAYLDNLVRGPVKDESVSWYNVCNGAYKDLIKKRVNGFDNFGDLAKIRKYYSTAVVTTAESLSPAGTFTPCCIINGDTKTGGKEACKRKDDIWIIDSDNIDFNKELRITDDLDQCETECKIIFDSHKSASGIYWFKNKTKLNGETCSAIKGKNACSLTFSSSDDDVTIYINNGAVSSTDTMKIIGGKTCDIFDSMSFYAKYDTEKGQTAPTYIPLETKNVEFMVEQRILPDIIPATLKTYSKIKLTKSMSSDEACGSARTNCNSLDGCYDGSGNGPTEGGNGYATYKDYSCAGGSCKAILAIENAGICANKGGGLPTAIEEELSNAYPTSSGISCKGHKYYLYGLCFEDESKLTIEHGVCLNLMKDGTKSGARINLPVMSSWSQEYGDNGELKDAGEGTVKVSMTGYHQNNKDDIDRATFRIECVDNGIYDELCILKRSSSEYQDYYGNETDAVKIQGYATNCEGCYLSPWGDPGYLNFKGKSTSLGSKSSGAGRITNKGENVYASYNCNKNVIENSINLKLEIHDTEGTTCTVDDNNPPSISIKVNCVEENSCYLKNTRTSCENAGCKWKINSKPYFTVCEPES